MRRCLILLAVLPMLAGCYATRIVTISPYSSNSGSYYTTVRTPGTRTVSSSTRVVAMDKDISLYLDLQAVGVAFAQSSTVEEFEYLLNDASYMLSNLDLNGDGYVDYNRVSRDLQRNDFGRQHPERSFSARNAGRGNVNPINARDIREAQREPAAAGQQTSGRPAGTINRGSGRVGRR